MDTMDAVLDTFKIEREIPLKVESFALTPSSDQIDVNGVVTGHNVVKRNSWLADANYEIHPIVRYLDNTGTPVYYYWSESFTLGLRTLTQLKADSTYGFTEDMYESYRITGGDSLYVDWHTYIKSPVLWQSADSVTTKHIFPKFTWNTGGFWRYDSLYFTIDMSGLVDSTNWSFFFGGVTDTTSDWVFKMSPPKDTTGYFVLKNFDVGTWETDFDVIYQIYYYPMVILYDPTGFAFYADYEPAPSSDYFEVFIPDTLPPDNITFTLADASPFVNITLLPATCDSADFDHAEVWGSNTAVGGSDSSLIKTFSAGGTDSVFTWAFGDSVWIWSYAYDEEDNRSPVYSDSIFGSSPDITPPNISGTITATFDSVYRFNIVENTNVHSDSGDFDYFKIYFKTHAADAFTWIVSMDTIATDTSLAFSNLVSYRDSGFIKITAVDTNSNELAAGILDTFVTSPFYEVYATLDTPLVVVSHFWWYRDTQDSSASAQDSARILMADADTTTSADTSRVPISPPNDGVGAYYWIRPVIDGALEPKSNSLWYPAPTLPSTFTLTGSDSDTVTVVATHWATEDTKLPDSVRIQYRTDGTYPTSQSNGTNLYASSFDSAEVNNDKFVGTWGPDDTVNVALFVYRNGVWNTSSKQDTAISPAVPAGDNNGAPSGTYLFAWNGDATLGDSATGFRNSTGDTITGYITGEVDIAAAYGQDGKGLMMDTVSNLGIMFKIDTYDIIKVDSGTVWFSIYRPDSVSGSTTYFWETNDGSASDMIYINNTANGRPTGYFKGNNTLQNVISNTAYRVHQQTWTRVAYSWDMVNDKHKIFVGGVHTGTTEETETLTDNTSALIEMWFGENEVGASQNEAIYIDNVYIVTRYSSTDPYSP